MKTQDGSSICIDFDFDEGGYDSFRFFIGEDEDNLTQVPVQNVRRMRDGGTTYVTLENGKVFYSPSSFKQGIASTLDGEELSKLETSKFPHEICDSK